MYLKTSFGIMENKILKEYEKKMVAVRLLEMSITGVTGDFSLNHFISIHKKLFGDVYFFAGEFRKENIAKGSFRFADYRYMENEITRLFQRSSKFKVLEINDSDGVRNVKLEAINDKR